MKHTGVVFFYNLNHAKGKKIRMLCLKMGLKIKNIDKSQYGEMLGALAGIEGYTLTGKEPEGEVFTDEMLVMKGFSSATLDAFLNGFRAMKIPPVALKAVLTDTNIDWDSIALHKELTREHEAMTAGQS